jgi:uncharacterized protein DUF2726
MMTLGWFLLALGFVGTIIYVVWNYRKKRAARAAARSERFSRIFTAAERSAIATGGGTGQAAREVTPTPTTPAVIPAAPGSYARRPSFLDARHSRLFALLDSGLPEHAIFAHVSLAAVLELGGLPEGREREQRLRGLAQQTLDCVVCSKAFDVVAAIDFEDGTTPEARFKAECLKAARVRYLRWNPLELPAVADLAALIAGNGETDPAGGPLRKGDRDAATS